MRLTATLFLVFMLALTALAGNGCKRPAGTGGLELAAFKLPPPTSQRAAPASHKAVVASVARLPHPAQAARILPVHDADDIEFTFCHPRADQLDRVQMSAAAAQVAYDTQATNDDRTEMMALEVEQSTVAPLPHSIAQAIPASQPMPWLQDLLRPPRALRA